MSATEPQKEERGCAPAEGERVSTETSSRHCIQQENYHDEANPISDSRSSAATSSTPLSRQEPRAATSLDVSLDLQDQDGSQPCEIGESDAGSFTPFGYKWLYYDNGCWNEYPRAESANIEKVFLLKNGSTTKSGRKFNFDTMEELLNEKSLKIKRIEEKLRDDDDGISTDKDDEIKINHDISQNDANTSDNKKEFSEESEDDDKSLDNESDLSDTDDDIDVTKIVPVDAIESWSTMAKRLNLNPERTSFQANDHFNEIVSVWVGDITELKIDAIVNAANETLVGFGGVSGCILRKGGSKLVEECASKGGCRTGDCEATNGYTLPCKYVLHAVGPRNNSAELLTSCYVSILKKADELGIKSLAFCSISTGIFGFSVPAACRIAVREVRKYLEHKGTLERIVFTIFTEDNYESYLKEMTTVFPWDPSVAGMEQQQ